MNDQEIDEQLANEFRRTFNAFRAIEMRYAELLLHERRDGRAVRTLVKAWLDEFYVSDYLASAGLSIPSLLLEAVDAANHEETTFLFGTPAEVRGRRHGDWTLTSVKGYAAAVLHFGTSVHKRPVESFAKKIARILFESGLDSGLSHSSKPYSTDAIRKWLREARSSTGRLNHSFKINSSLLNVIAASPEEALNWLAWECTHTLGPSGRNGARSSGANR